RSSASPALWLSDSFTSLKRSRSKHSSASWPRVRAALRTACPARSVSSQRFGSPVSASRVARYSARASALLRAVTSAPVPRKPLSSLLELAEGLGIARLAGEPALELAGVGERHEVLRPAAEHLGARIAEHALGALREVGVAPGGVGLPDEFSGRLDHVGEALLALGRRALGALALADVRDHAAHAPGAPVAGALGDAAARVQPGPLAGAVREAELGVELRRLVLQRPHERLAQRRAVVGMDLARDVGAARELGRALVPEEARPAVAGVEHVGVELEVPLGEVGAVEGELQAPLRLGERRLGAALLGDVAPDAAVAEHARARVAPALPGDD